MNIYILGTICSGKTTLFNKCLELIGSNPKVGFVTDACREYAISIPNSLEYRSNFEVQKAMQALFLKKEKQISNMFEHLIIETTVISPAVYLETIGDMGNSLKLTKIALKNLDKNGKFFLLSNRFISFENDDLRKESKLMSSRMATNLEKWLEKNHIIYELLEGTVEERSQRVLSAVI